MDDITLAGDLEYIASRTYGTPGDKERAETFRLAAIRLRALREALTNIADAHGNDETTARFCKGLAREALKS